MYIERFAHPELLWLLTILVPMAGYYVFRTRQGGATIRVSTTASLAGVRRGAKRSLRHLPAVLRGLAVAAIIVALARPQTSESNQTSTTEGIDLVIALDISTSMWTRDFTPDRLEAAKEVSRDFIANRPNDRMGLVVFAAESFTQCPLTTDRATLLGLLANVHSGMVEDGTAIGNGLATAINRLQESQAASKVVILLTDGVNNRGQITPLTAAEIAQTLGIRVYTIGVGTRGTAPSPAIDPWGALTFVMAKVEIDEETLSQIATMTGGEYFRATDKEKLKEIYDRINELEKSKIEVDDVTLYHERFLIFALAAALLLLMEFLLKNFYLRQIP